MTNSTFKGLFNYYQQVFELFTIATSERVAFGNFITQLEKKAEVDRQFLRFYFNGKFDNYSITKVKEEKDEFKMVI